MTTTLPHGWHEQYHDEMAAQFAAVQVAPDEEIALGLLSLSLPSDWGRWAPRRAGQKATVLTVAVELVASRGRQFAELVSELLQPMDGRAGVLAALACAEVALDLEQWDWVARLREALEISN